MKIPFADLKLDPAAAEISRINREHARARLHSLLEQGMPVADLDEWVARELADAPIAVLIDCERLESEPVTVWLDRVLDLLSFHPCRLLPGRITLDDAPAGLEQHADA